MKKLIQYMKSYFDSYPFSRKGSAIICIVSMMHIFQALLLYNYPNSSHATCMKAVLFIFSSLGINILFASKIITLTAVLALCGTLLRLGWFRLCIFIPQHFFLGIMSIGGMYAVWNGQYLDGTIIGWEHILSDQLPMLALFIIHSSAIIRRAREQNG